MKALIFFISFGFGCNFWDVFIGFNKCLRVLRSRFVYFCIYIYISRRDHFVGVGEGYEWVSSEGVKFSAWKSNELIVESIV